MTPTVTPTNTSTLTPTPTKTQTINDEYLGRLGYFGVDSTSNYDYGAFIQAIQNGTAGTKVPTDMFLYTYNNSDANTNQVTLSYKGTVGIMRGTPNVTLDVAGPISCDAIKWSARATVSADVTGGAPCLTVSKDPAGNISLNFFNGSVWKKVSLE
jgi:hypothetical protein